MTTYNVIADSALDPDAPLTSELAYRWRDNPLAIAEGAVGAPRIYGAAMFGPVAGAVIQRKCTPIRSVSSSSTTPDTEKAYAAYFTAMVECIVRVTTSCTVTVTSGTTGEMYIYKNGTSIQTYSSSQTNATVDVTLAAGDAIAVELRAVGTSGGATGTISVSKLEYSFNARSAVMS